MPLLCGHLKLPANPDVSDCRGLIRSQDWTTASPSTEVKDLT